MRRPESLRLPVTIKDDIELVTDDGYTLATIFRFRPASLDGAERVGALDKAEAAYIAYVLNTHEALRAENERLRDWLLKTHDSLDETYSDGGKR